MASWPFVFAQSRRPIARIASVCCLLSALLLGAQPSSALTLDTFTPRFEGNVAGDFALTGNTVLTCSTTNGDLGAASCDAARRRLGPTADNDNHYMRNIEVPVGGLSGADVFNSSSNFMSIPADAHVVYAELFWSGTLLVEPGDVSASSAANKDRVIFAVGDDDCTGPSNPCLVTAQSADVVQEELGADLGQYRASAVVTARLQQAPWKSERNTWQSLVTVGNIQTAQGVDKAAGWSLAVVFASPGHEMRHVQVLGGFGVVARRSGATVPLEGFLTPSRGDVSSSIGLVAFDGDLGDASDSMYLRQDTSQTVLEDGQNPELNIANSTISSGGQQSAYLDDATPEQAANTFGVDSDRIDLMNALGHNSTQATLVMSSQQDTWFPVGLAYSTELPSADIALEKFVSEVSGAPSTQVNIGDSLTYTIRVTNSGNGSASRIVIRDDIPADLTVTASSGTNCTKVQSGQICKIINTLAAGAYTEITITGTVNGTSQLTAGVFTNQADAHYKSHLGDNVAVSNRTTTEYGPLAVDLMSELEFSDDYIQAGDETTLEASITNFGPINDEDPSVELLITRGAASVSTLPTGCVPTTTTRVTCSAEAFGISPSQPLEPRQSKTLKIDVRPDALHSGLLMKQIVHTGVVAGDVNVTNNTSYAQVAINHVPVAEPLKIIARAGGPAIVTSLDTHVSDPDEDALHILVGQSMHGTVMQLGTRIRYAPPGQWHGTQRVGYTVSDGKGGATESYIVIVVRPASTVIDNGSQDKPLKPHRQCFVVRRGC